MKGGEKRQPAIYQRSQCLAQVECCDGIEPVEGFVQYHKGLAAGKRQCDGSSLPHPCGTVAYPFVKQLIDTERSADRAKALARGVDVATYEFEQIADAQRLWQTIGGRCESEALRASHAVFDEVCAIDDARSRSERQASCERTKETRLPGSVGADQPAPASRRHDEVDVMDDAGAGSIDRCSGKLNRHGHVSSHVAEPARWCRCQRMAMTTTGNSIGIATAVRQAMPAQILTSVSAMRFEWTR